MRCSHPAPEPQVPCYRFPATRPTAIRTLSELRCTEEFSQMVEAALGKLEHHHEGELNAIQSKVERLATRCSALMARSALPSSETVYMDSDLSCAVPGEVAEQFDLLWALGAMASLAHGVAMMPVSQTASSGPSVAASGLPTRPTSASRGSSARADAARRATFRPSARSRAAAVRRGLSRAGSGRCG